MNTSDQLLNELAISNKRTNFQYFGLLIATWLIMLLIYGHLFVEEVSLTTIFLIIIEMLT